MRLPVALLLLGLPLLGACASAAQTSTPATAPASSTRPSASASAPRWPVKVVLDRCSDGEADVTVTNRGRATATVQVAANFLIGATVEDANTSGFSDPLGPGQRERLVIDNVVQYASGTYGPGSPVARCQLTGYAVQRNGVLVGTWPAR